MMFSFIRDRQQEIALLRFAKMEAQYLKHNIEEAKKLEPVYKANGEIHKTKTKERQVVIKAWEKELGKLRSFFNTHKQKGRINDWKRYKYRRSITDNRSWIEDLFASNNE